MKLYSKVVKDLSTLISPTNDNAKAKRIVLADKTEWTDIIEFANQRLLVPTLYSALKDKECFDLIQDELVKEYLETVYGYNLSRNKSILKQLQKLADIFLQINVTPVLLKSAAALSEGYYKDIGARVMSDIDILVPEDRIEECVKLLESKYDYKPVDESHKLFSSHHWRRMYSEDGTAALELHFKALSSTSYPYFNNEVLNHHLKHSKQISNAMVLEPTFDLYHVFLHSEISDHSHEYKALALRHLHHGSTIISAFGRDIQWEELDRMVKQHNIEQKWKDYLYIQYSLFHVDIPSEFLEDSGHLDKILLDIDKVHNGKESIIDFIWGYVKEIFSFNELKRKYGFKTKWGYPIALMKSLGKGIFKLLFVPKVRNNVLEYLKKRKKFKKYGRHY